MLPSFADNSATSIPIHVVAKPNFEAWLDEKSEQTKSWAKANKFTGALGQLLLLPNAGGKTKEVIFGWGDESARARGRFHLAKAVEALPQGVYSISSELPGPEVEEGALGWLLSAYQFDRYKTKKSIDAILKFDSPESKKLEAIAAAEFLTRDLINTPANDMGPEALEKEFRALAEDFQADVSVISGDDLLSQNFPLIHAVGRASDQAPRLLDMTWGDPQLPKVTLVGKGVCFDTGGLNLKPGASMGLMKKDMGGAATVMGLARLIMSLDLPVRLRILVPAVENSVSARAMRPGDVLASRKGLSIEVNNTDAEGRLVLADTLALADEDAPRHLFCMATLTGAARVALGPDLAPFYSDDEELASSLINSGDHVRDPLWRMPFWEPYEAMIEPDIADLDNAPAGGMAGSITAALFLRRFVESAQSFAHFDIYGWNPKAAPARPKGGAFLGARAIFETLRREFPC